MKNAVTDKTTLLVITNPNNPTGTILSYQEIESFINKVSDKFENKIDFKTTLIPYRVDTSWIEEKIVEMKDVLNSEKVPETEKSCEKCAYLKGGKDFF